MNVCWFLFFGRCVDTTYGDSMAAIEFNIKELEE
jgi:hypothetical protein